MKWAAMHKAQFFESEADGARCIQGYPRERSRNKERQRERKRENLPQRQPGRKEV